MAVFFFIISILSMIFLIVFGLVPVYKKTQNTKKNGIEAEAIVTGIEADYSDDATSCDCYVRYSTVEGQAREAWIQSPGSEVLRVGYKNRIRYLPEQHDVAVRIKERKRG